MKTKRCLAIAFVLSASALAAVPVDWSTIIAPEHRPSVERTLDFVRSVNAELVSGPLRLPPGIYPVEQRAFAPTVAFSDAEILGEWKCHSLQCGLEGGIFPVGVRGYAKVAARITRDKEGRLIFDKATDPRMIRGYLFADADGARRVFLGQRRSWRESAADYSRLVEGDDPEMARKDSVGVLRKRPDGSMVLILDASPTGYEICELTR